MKRTLSTAYRRNPFRLILAGFFLIILLGALLLTLPVASRDGLSAPFEDALFTATSAVCVTGLIVRDTATGWSAFGQTIIILLIQIGGLGVVTVAAATLLLTGQRIGISHLPSRLPCRQGDLFQPFPLHFRILQRRI